jgi:hypothetical protein
MLVNNLSTDSVTKHQMSNNEKGAADQSIEVQFGKIQAARWLVTIKQKDGTKITTESIGTPKTGYVRYTDIETRKKAKDGTPYDFSSIINVWGKSDKKHTSLNQLFSQAVIDIQNAPLPPIGKLDASERQNLLGFMNEHDVFTVDTNNIKHKTIDGRQMYVYTVKVKLQPYFEAIQQFAKSMGLHDLDQVDTSSYKNTPPATLELTVDPETSQLVQASYPDAGYTENYSKWGQTEQIKTPQKTIPVDTLEKRLQKFD